MKKDQPTVQACATPFLWGNLQEDFEDPTFRDGRHIHHHDPLRMILSKSCPRRYEKKHSLSLLAVGFLGFLGAEGYVWVSWWVRDRFMIVSKLVYL